MILTGHPEKVMDINKVLLVDDDQCIRRIAQFCLERIGGWQVLAARNGLEAIEYARAEKPDVIVLDFRLPDMDGPSILAKLRSVDNTRDIPIILMTARVQSSEIAEYQDLDVSGVIAKPFDPMTLSSQIKALLSSPGTLRRSA